MQPAAGARGGASHLRAATTPGGVCTASAESLAPESTTIGTPVLECAWRCRGGVSRLHAAASPFVGLPAPASVLNTYIYPMKIYICIHSPRQSTATDTLPALY
jgi:hypothetical protein